MPTINDVKKRVFFTKQEYFDTMVAEGSVTVDGVTYPYSPSDTDYFTPYNNADNTEINNALAEIIGEVVEDG